MHPLLLASRALAPSTLSYLSSPALCCALAIVVAAPERAAADDEAPTVIGPRAMQPVVPDLTAGAPVFKICRDQTYALCAVASCYVFDQVAYCKCDVEDGDSISLPFEVDGEDVCDVNARGPANGYMVSTFSLPDAVVEGGPMALYTCPAGSSDGAYAQCDGGLCFTSTEAAPSFPGFDEPLAEGKSSAPVRSRSRTPTPRPSGTRSLVPSRARPPIFRTATAPPPTAGPAPRYRSARRLVFRNS